MSINETIDVDGRSVANVVGVLKIDGAIEISLLTCDVPVRVYQDNCHFIPTIL